MPKQLNDLTLVLATVETANDGTSYPVTFVLRYDFQGTVEDLRKVADVLPHLFIEGGQMHSGQE